MITDRIAVYVLGAATLVLVVAAGTQTWRLHSEEKAHAETQRDYATRLLAAEKKAREESERNRLLEGQLAASAKENQDALDKEREAGDRARDALAADNGRLRNTIARYASGGGQPAAPACTAERERATELGRLLGEALQSSEAGAIDAEGLAADVRALLRDGRDIRATLKGAP